MMIGLDFTCTDTGELLPNIDDSLATKLESVKDDTIHEGVL